MTGASSRFIFLLTNPISFLHHRPSTFFRSLRRRPLTTLTAASNRHHLRYSHYNSHIPIKFSQNYCSRATNYSFQDNNQVPANEGHVSPVHPWPEWSRLLDSLYNAGYFNGNCNVEDEFVVTEKFSMEFVDAANSCLAFARDKPDILGWLPRSDIKVLVDDGYPFLFKNAEEIEIKMRAFLQVEGSNEATSVDLMKYILSYVSNFIVYPERNIKEATESCVRRLLQEMANVSYRDRASDQYEQTPRIVSPNITMKRGDWICAKCNFMNFARNAKCLECEELRPQRQLTNGEWDCPRCNFFNYRKNVVCMKCECRRPDDAQLHGSSPGQTYFRNKQTHDSEKENRTETWFKKVMELHGLTGQPRDITHDDLPIRKEEDHFTNNNDKDGRFSPYQRQQAMEHGKNSSFAPFVPFPPDYFAKKHDTKSTESTVKPTNENSYSNNAIINKKLVQGTENHQMRSTTNVDSRSYISNRTIFKGEMNTDLCSNQFRRNERKPESNRTLFSGDMNTSSSGNQFSRNEPKPEGSRTLFSGDMNTSSSGNQFTRNEPKPEGNRTLYNRDINTNSSSNQLRRNEPKAEDNRTLCSGDMNTDSFNNEFRRNEPRPEVGQRIPESMNVRSGWTGKSLEGSAVTEPDPLDMSEEAKAERWFKRVAQIKDISELSQIPDEDFPSIMPMRKGVNRFVVSKRKTPLERRLTSQYRKNLRIVSSDPMKKEGNDDS